MPAEKPETTPLEFMVAIPVEALFQVPPGVEFAKVVVEPIQTDVVPVIAFKTGNAFTVTVIDAQVVVLQVPVYLTKYVVSPGGVTVIALPVPTAVPPQEPLNHCAVAPVPTVPPLKVRVVELPTQIDEVPVILVGAIDSAFTVKILVAVLVVQLPLARV